jgi:sugar/nucleoside kinase (ribokinase family)
MTDAPDILCIGSVLWDVIGRAPGAMAHGDDVAGRIRRQPGGVAMNIATALAGHGLRPALLTAVGEDSEGRALIEAARQLGLLTDHVHRMPGRPTDRYMAVEAANGLIAAIADAHSLEAAGAAILAPLADGRLGSAAAPWAGPVALDGNLAPALLAEIAGSPLFARAALAVAPASPGKATRLAAYLGHGRATLYLNLEEARLLAGRAFATAAEAAAALVAAGTRRVLVTDGPNAAALADGAGVLAALPPAVTPCRVTGAGDCFMAAHVAAEWRGMARAAALDFALRAAAAHVGAEVAS